MVMMAFHASKRPSNGDNNPTSMTVVQPYLRTARFGVTSKPSGFCVISAKSDAKDSKTLALFSLRTISPCPPSRCRRVRIEPFSAQTYYTITSVFLLCFSFLSEKCTSVFLSPDKYTSEKETFRRGCA